MIAVNYSQLFQLALPEVIVVVTALLVLALDLLSLRKHRIPVRFTIASSVASLGCLAAILWMLRMSQQANFLDGMLIANPLTQLVQIALLVLAILTLLMSVGSTFTEHVGEFILLVLLATAGMMFLVASRDILVIFISLELLSLSLYVLTAFDKRSARSSEAALKYFLFGGMSAAFLLFGFSLLYGLSGSTNLMRIARVMPGPSFDSIAAITIVTTIIGFGFKIAAFPFHFWAPDVYEGAPTPSAAFIASSSKVASFFIFSQVMVIAFAGVEGSSVWHPLVAGWVPALVIVAALSMILGNLVAIVQSRVRRLLAYSAIAHAGYMLLGILSHTQQSLAALLYYVITYALATLGAFGVVAVVEQRTGDNRLEDFEGLGRNAPIVSMCMFVFLLSLAGIPPLAGFFGKFYLFISVLAMKPGSLSLFWLVILAIVMSAVSLYYYLQVLKRIYVVKPSTEVGSVHVPMVSQIILVLLALAVIVLGCAPNLLLNWLQGAIRASVF